MIFLDDKSIAFEPFAFRHENFLSGFPYIFYARLKKKSFINTVEVFWFDNKVRKQRIEYELSVIEKLLNKGILKKIDMDITNIDFIFKG